MAYEISREEWLDLMSRMGGGGQRASMVPSTTGQGQSGNVYSEELELSDGGGGGGMNYMSAFTDLGDRLHKNALSTADWFSGMRRADRGERRQAMLDAENKRQFNKNYGLASRDRNLNAMNYLAGIRGAAGTQAARRLPFRDALASTLR
jgi:hypothetical protein